MIFEGHVVMKFQLETSFHCYCLTISSLADLITAFETIVLNINMKSVCEDVNTVHKAHKVKA